jgi:hypothetical protein
MQRCFTEIKAIQWHDVHAAAIAGLESGWPMRVPWKRSDSDESVWAYIQHQADSIQP